MLRHSHRKSIRKVVRRAVNMASGGNRPPSGYTARWNAAGVDSKGVSSATVQPGRAYTGACTISIPGLLTTDTILADSTDQPTCSVNGTLTIAAGAVVYGVSISRASVQIGYYPCAEGAGTTCLNKLSGGSALPHGTISAATVHTEIYDGTGFDLNMLGYSNRQNLVTYSGDFSNAAWSKVTMTVTAAGDYFKIDFVSGGYIYNAQPGYGYTANAMATLLYANIALSPVPRRRMLMATASDGRKFAVVFDAYDDGNAQYDGATPYVYERSDGRLRFGFSQFALSGYFYVKNLQAIELIDAESPSLGTIVCLGDSISLNYPTHLARLFPNSTVVNATVGGDTISGAITRFAADVAAEDPHIILLMIGSNSMNDQLATMQTNMLSLLELCDATGARVVLGETIPRTGWSAELIARQAAFNAWLHTLGYEVAEHHADFLQPNTTNDLMYNYTTDGIHPSEWQSFNYLAENFAQKLGWDYPEYIETTTLAIAGKQPASSATLDALGNALQYPGSIKLSLLGPDGVQYWPSAPKLIAVTGVDNAVFDAGGIGKTFATEALALAALATEADDTYLFVGPRGGVLYPTDMSAKADKINKYLGNTVTPDELYENYTDQENYTETDNYED